MAMVAEKLSLVNEIHGGSRAWKVKVKIISLFKKTFSNNPQLVSSLNMVLIDEQGSRIQATVKRNLIDQYEPFLQEGGIRVLSRFSVGENEGSFLLTRHRCKINFKHNTGVQLCNDWAGPEQSFELRHFSDILTSDFDSMYSFDAIGEVIHCQDTKIMNMKGLESRVKCLQLQNEEGIKTKCVIWDEHATKLDAFLADSGRNDVRVIMLVQFAKLGEWESLNSSIKHFTAHPMFGSKVWINEDLRAFAEFKDRLLTVNAEQIADRILSSTTVYINPLDYWQKFECKNINELLDIKQATICVVVATVTKIETKNGWFYHACKKCSKKVDRLFQPVDENNDDAGVARFVCSECGVVTDVYPKIQLQVRVQDATGSISFVIFERDVKRYIHKSASELINNATSGEHFELFPTEFNIFVGKRFAWRFNVSNYNIETKLYVYIVNNFTDEDTVIEAIIKKPDGDEDGPSNVDLQVLRELPSVIGLNSKDDVFGTGENDNPVDAMKSTASSSGSKKVIEHDDRDMVTTGLKYKG